MRISFICAAQEVTGSCFLVDAATYASWWIAACIKAGA
jgi:hypothetical protein